MSHLIIIYFCVQEMLTELFEIECAFINVQNTK